MNTALAPTLLTRYLPRLDRRARDVLLVFVSSIFIALMAQVRIPLPFTPVPITGQTFAVLLIGAALGSERGAASLLVYLAEGAAGLPAFAGGTSGLAVLVGPTGGYLIGFVFAAYIIGRLAESGLDRRFLERAAYLPGGGRHHLSIRGGLVECFHRDSESTRGRVVSLFNRRCPQIDRGSTGFTGSLEAGQITRGHKFERWSHWIMNTDKQPLSWLDPRKRSDLVTSPYNECFISRTPAGMSIQEVLFMEPKRKRTSEALNKE